MPAASAPSILTQVQWLRLKVASQLNDLGGAYRAFVSITPILLDMSQDLIDTGQGILGLHPVVAF